MYFGIILWIGETDCVVRFQSGETLSDSAVYNFKTSCRKINETRVVQASEYDQKYDKVAYR